MAERGSKSPLSQEVQDAIGAGTVTVAAYDAGTDSGESYTSADRATSPRDPISRTNGYPMTHNGSVAPIGTFTFRRVQ